MDRAFVNYIRHFWYMQEFGEKVVISQGSEMRVDWATEFSGENTLLLFRYGKERHTFLAMLPYRLLRSSRSFSDYRRVGS